MCLKDYGYVAGYFLPKKHSRHARPSATRQGNNKRSVLNFARTDPPGLGLRRLHRFGFICLRFREIQSPLGFFLLQELQRQFALLHRAPQRRHRMFTLQTWHLLFIYSFLPSQLRCNSAPHWQETETQFKFQWAPSEFNENESNYALKLTRRSKAATTEPHRSNEGTQLWFTKSQPVTGRATRYTSRRPPEATAPRCGASLVFIVPAQLFKFVR